MLEITKSQCDPKGRYVKVDPAGTLLVEGIENWIENLTTTVVSEGEFLVVQDSETGAKFDIRVHRE